MALLLQVGHTISITVVAYHVAYHAALVVKVCYAKGSICMNITHTNRKLSMASSMLD